MIKRILTCIFALLITSSAWGQWVQPAPGLPLSGGVLSGSVRQVVQPFGWGNTATVSSVILSGSGLPVNAPVMGGFSTNTGQATYFSRDQVPSLVMAQDNIVTTTQATVSSFTTTSVVLSAPIACSLVNARSGNVAGSLISTNDTPKFSGEVTNVNCSGGTTSTLTVSGWFQVVGAFIASAVVVGNGTSGCVDQSVVTVGHPSAPDGGFYDWQGTLKITVGGGVISSLAVQYAGSYAQGNNGPLNNVNLIGSGCASTPTATLTMTNVAANTAAGQTPTGTLVQINPVTSLYTINYVCTLQGTTQTRRCQGGEVDINNNTGFDEISSPGQPILRGWDVVNTGANAIGTQVILRGKSLYGLTLGDGTAGFGSLGMLYLNSLTAPTTIVSNVGTLDFYTSNDIPGANNAQFEIGHAANAVNRVQAIGASTGAAPTLLPVGSDSNIILFLRGKGASGVLIRPGSDVTTAFQVQNTAGTSTILAVDTVTSAIKANAGVVSGGTKPTLTGTCTTGSQIGGLFAGTFTATCTAQTVIMSFGQNAPNGWACDASDLTTSADTLKQTASAAGSATFTGTTVAADVISFKCLAY